MCNRFILVDIGNARHHSDGGILANSEFGKALDAGALSIPNAFSLPGTTSLHLPYVIVGDEAFPLKSLHVMALSCMVDICLV